MGSCWTSCVETPNGESRMSSCGFSPTLTLWTLFLHHWVQRTVYLTWGKQKIPPFQPKQISGWLEAQAFDWVQPPSIIWCKSHCFPGYQRCKWHGLSSPKLLFVCHWHQTELPSAQCDKMISFSSVGSLFSSFSFWLCFQFMSLEYFYFRLCLLRFIN